MDIDFVPEPPVPILPGILLVLLAGVAVESAPAAAAISKEDEDEDGSMSRMM